MTDTIVEPNPDDIKKLKQRERVLEQKLAWARRNRAHLTNYSKKWASENYERQLEITRPYKAAYARRKKVEKLYLQELQWFLYKEHDVELDIDPLI
jgi:hypothetical protein